VRRVIAGTANDSDARRVRFQPLDDLLQIVRGHLESGHARDPIQEASHGDGLVRLTLDVFAVWVASTFNDDVHRSVPQGTGMARPDAPNSDVVASG